MLTHTLSQSWSNGAVTISGSSVVTNSGDASIDKIIAEDASAAEIICSLPLPGAVSLYIYSKDSALTLKTNSQGSPDNTFLIPANSPFLWISGLTSLKDSLGASVGDRADSLFITNTGGVETTLQIRVLFNPEFGIGV